MEVEIIKTLDSKQTNFHSNLKIETVKKYEEYFQS